MTAFLQQHRAAAALFVVPFPADKRRARMIISDMLVRTDIHNFSDFTVQNQLFDPAIKRSVTQNMTDHQFAVVAFHTLFQERKLLLVVADGFFQKHVITCIQEGQGSDYMQRIHCAIDYTIRNFSLRGKRIKVGKAPVVRQ